MDHCLRTWLRAGLALLLILCMLMPTGAALAEGDAPGRVVRVGWFPHPGGAEGSDGEYAGYNYDYLMKIAAYTGWTYEFVEADFATCAGLLKRGEIDLIGSLFKNEERMREYDFAELDYGQSYTTLLTSAESDLSPYDFERFDGMRVGVVKGAINVGYLERFAADNGFTYRTTEFYSIEAMKAAILLRTVDAGVLAGYIASPELKVLAEFSPQPCYFATTKGNTELLVELNRALNRIRIDEPFLELALYQKHFRLPENLELTEKERALVAASKEKPITVGIIPSSAPACYWDEARGEYVGIFMEVLAAISEKTVLQFEYVALDNTEMTPLARVKQAKFPDVVAGMLRTQQYLDDKSLVLSDGLLDDALVIVGRKGDDFTNRPEEKVIAVPVGFSVARAYIAEQFPKHAVHECADVMECLREVESGSADAMLYMRTSISYFLQNPHFEELEIIPAFSKDVETCMVGLAETQTTLINVVNKGLAKLTESERNGITMNFTIMNPYRVTTADMLYKYRVPLMIITVLVVIIIAVLLSMSASDKRNKRKVEEAYAQEQAAHEQEKLALAAAEKASAAKGSFMSRMSHEIRTPLNAVIGYNMIARNEMSAAKDDAERRQADMKVMDCLTKSEMASKHLLTIINDVLDMSAIENGRIQVAHERFDFKSMISSLTTLFYSQAKAKNVRFAVEFETPTEEWFVGDQMRVSQILTNLLSNAVKFTPSGGSVRLTVHETADDASLAHMRFTVTDTGIGMTQAYLTHIWTPFEQADVSISRRFGGTGLGLSITKSLVDLMGGAISVESEPGLGSTFTVEMEFERTRQQGNGRTYDFSGVRALVVDDDASACDYVSLLFSRCDVACETCLSGEAAVEAFTRAMECGKPFTVCLVDWRMPNMDGLETVQRIRAMAGDTLPIIIVTAYDFAEIADAAKLAGVSMFIAKPLFQSSLFDLLMNICGNKTPARISGDSEYDFSGKRVLLAEDNAMNMEVAKKVLEAARFSVDGAINGEEVVQRFAESAPGTYDAILMDVQMPEMDGHQATRAIRLLAHPDAKSIPIIAMTADAFAENVAEALASGMNDHVAKPIDVRTLYDTLQKHLFGA